jgi:N12 class adenine-specific DNA methylase
MRRKRQRRQRTRRFFLKKRHSRKQKGGSLPVPTGSLVAVSLGGEYGVPVLMPKDQYESEKEKEGLED